MEKLNVCLINDSFPPVIDGVANAVVNYADVITRNHGNVVVATPEVPGAVDDYPYEVLRYPSLDTTDAVGYRTGIPFDPGYLSQFTDRPIDIIHTHCPITSMFLARIIRQQAHKPIVLTYHTKFDIDIARSIDSKLIQDVAIKALVGNIAMADEVWTVSRGAGENLKSLGYTGDYLVMPNGVDFTKGASSQQEIDAVRQQYGIPTGKPVYLFVGRMMWYKGIRIIVDALAKLKAAGTDFAMVFVGGGIEADDIKKYVEECHLTENTIYTGPISDRNQLKAVFSACDLFLFPSTFDTNGIVVREAASAALGSVLIKGSCAAEDTEDGVNTIWIDENADSLAKVLIQAGNDMSYFHQIGQNAQDQLYLSWDESVANAYQRYQVIVDKYQYEKAENIHDFSESFFSMWSGLAYGVTKAKEARQLTVERNAQFSAQLREAWDKLAGDEARAKLHATEEQWRHYQDLVRYRRAEIQDYLDDVADRYL